MLIKNKDKNESQIDYLVDLLSRDIPEDKKQYIDRELKTLRSGEKGEKSSSYYLNFDLNKTDNWAIIHDLRLEHDGDVAQIDHLVIGRMMDIYVIESKNFNSGVTISNEGEFSYFYKNRPQPIPSPILQNERHITLLKRFFQKNKLLPTRLGITLKPNYINIVLISPTSRLTKPKKGLYDCSSVMKSDQFSTRFKDNNNLDNSSTLEVLSSISKIISSHSLRTFSEKLCSFHKPNPINYQAKFNLDLHVKENAIAEQKTTYEESPPTCPKCHNSMINKLGTKGSFKNINFWGCSKYPKCRGLIKLEENSDELSETNEKPCPKCNAPMIKRVTKSGKHEGQTFWGCSTFPKCRTTVSLDQD